MFAKATLQQKLMAGFGVLMLSALVGTIYSIVVIRGLTAVVSKAAGIHELGKIATASSDMVGLEGAIVLHAIFDNKAQVEQYKTQFEATSQAFQRLLSNVETGLASENGRAMVKEL